MTAYGKGDKVSVCLDGEVVNLLPADGPRRARIVVKADRDGAIHDFQIDSNDGFEITMIERAPRYKAGDVAAIARKSGGGPLYDNLIGQIRYRAESGRWLDYNGTPMGSDSDVDSGYYRLVLRDGKPVNAA